MEINHKERYGLLVLCVFLIAHTAAAVRVAVVIDTPGQLITKCITTTEDSNAYTIMQQTGQDISWTYYGQALGHGLCSITGIGCPSSNCYCDPNSYWNFYAKETGENGRTLPSASTEEHHAPNTTALGKARCSALRTEATEQRLLNIPLTMFAAACQATARLAGAYRWRK